MKKAWLTSIFVTGMLLATGYALATPETDEISKSLDLLENLAEEMTGCFSGRSENETGLAEEPHPEVSFLPSPEPPAGSQSLADKNEDEDGFFRLDLQFLDASLPPSEPDNHHGDLSSHTHGIPEPMAFDLVRPLGAKKGELEINTLFLGGWYKGGFSRNWAPEVEYAFRDGMAVEFELPVNGLRPQDLKFAFQATLPSRLERVAHGFQLFKEYDLHHRHLGMTAVHITGLRLTDRVSLVSINGARNAHMLKKPDLTALMNHSLFYRLSDKVTLGLETNLSLKRRNNAYQFLPQVHVELAMHYSMQIGAGFRREAHAPFVPVVGLRLIHTF